MFTNASIWEQLKQRRTADNIRRPLIVVYDEGHNLSDQQTELLMELEPDGFFLASATMRLPARLAVEVDRLRAVGWTDQQLVTQIKSSDVVNAGLVKASLLLAGYNSSMEETVSTMLADMADAEAQAEALELSFPLKAIYVCNTNMVASNAFQPDDPRKPFKQRQAPPILIWRYLTEQCGVDPSTIAVYSNLATHKTAQLPDDFVLFKGAESDYEEFIAGDYRHIIFNLKLQEGWDDPQAYFAYVDKSMNSRAQITQIIGRVLRQPGAMHYSQERLNTAHFYVRVDRNETFNEMLKDVGKQLGAELAEIRIVSSPPGGQKPIAFAPREALTVPVTALLASDSRDAVDLILKDMPDYRLDTINSKSEGSRRLARQEIGVEQEVGDWETFEYSSRVSARWALTREIQRRFRPTLDVVDLTDPKLDAIIGIGSPAYKTVSRLAADAVNAFVENVRLKQRRLNPYVVGALLARPDDVDKFHNSLHEGYAGLNGLERRFAEALDGTGKPWSRNVPRTGYGLPLITVGATDKYYPDFLVWTDRRVICLDTKGPHLVAETATRKLLHIRPSVGDGRHLDVQFITEGRWNKELRRETTEGFTYWGLGDDGGMRVRHFTDLAALVELIVVDPPIDDD